MKWRFFSIYLCEVIWCRYNILYFIHSIEILKIIDWIVFINQQHSICISFTCSLEINSFQLWILF